MSLSIILRRVDEDHRIVTGALVRFRANYNPKGLQLDAEGGAQPYTGPVVSTFFGMLKRVHRIEVCIYAY